MIIGIIVVFMLEFFFANVPSVGKSRSENIGEITI
jgi:hypothetical protein